MFTHHLGRFRILNIPAVLNGCITVQLQRVMFVLFPLVFLQVRSFYNTLCLMLCVAWMSLRTAESWTQDSSRLRRHWGEPTCGLFWKKYISDDLFCFYLVCFILFLLFGHLSESEIMFKVRNVTMLWCGYNRNTVFTHKLKSRLGTTLYSWFLLKMKHFTSKKGLTPAQKEQPR